MVSSSGASPVARRVAICRQAARAAHVESESSRAGSSSVRALATLADLTGARVVRPEVIETTALGAAYLAGVGAGLYSSLAEVGENWREDRVFEPATSAADRERRIAGWRDAVRRVMSG